MATIPADNAPADAGSPEGILRGMYLAHVGGQGKVRVQLMGAGTIGDVAELLLERLVPATAEESPEPERVPA